MNGLILWGNDLPLTHQQFLNDIMLYGQATLKEAKKIMEILTDLRGASGIEISKEKSEIYFFNTEASSQAFLGRTMGSIVMNIPTKYLGILLNDKQNKVANWGTPQRTRAVTEENDREEGRAKSRRVGRRMITSDRTRTAGT